MVTLTDLLANYSVEAIRVELLPEYHSASEWDKYQNFLKTGDIIDIPELVPYLENAYAKSQQEARHVRIRVIPELSPYIVFENKVAYKKYPDYNIQLHFVLKEKFDAILQGVGINSVKDFWLFDKRTIAQMVYDPSGKFQGIELLSNDLLPVYSDLVSKLIEVSFSPREIGSIYPELR